jgi:hypothetical protein
MLWKLSCLGLECTWRIYYIELRLLHLCPCASLGVCWWAWSSGVAPTEHRQKWSWRSSDYVNFPNPVFSNPVFRIRLSEPNPVFRIRLSGSNPVFRIRLPGPNPIFQILFPFSESRFGIPFSESDCPGRISFSESDCPGRFRQQIKTRNCRVKWTDARSEFIYKICKPWQNEAHCTWFNGRKNIYAMNNMVILDH